MSIQAEPGEAAALDQRLGQARHRRAAGDSGLALQTIIDPLKRELRELRPNPNDAVGAVVPEFVVRYWWQSFLHTQTAFFIKASLLFEPDVVVINVPYRLGYKGVKQARSRLPQLAESHSI